MSTLNRPLGFREIAKQFDILCERISALPDVFDLTTENGRDSHDALWDQLVSQFCWWALATDRFDRPLPLWQCELLMDAMWRQIEPVVSPHDQNQCGVQEKPEQILNIESEAECNSAIQGILKWLDRDDEDADADAELTGVWKGPLDMGVLQYVKYGAVYGSDSDCLPDRERVSNSVDRKGGQLL